MNILSRVKIKGKMYKSSINVVNDTFNQKYISDQWDTYNGVACIEATEEVASVKTSPIN